MYRIYVGRNHFTADLSHFICSFQIIMDLHLELEEEEVEYLESIGIAETLGETLTQALKSLSSEKPPEPLLSLVVEGMARAAGKGLSLLNSHVVMIEKHFSFPPGLSTWTAVQGIPVTCNPDVSLSLGPVVGEVTSTSAIIMLEVSTDAVIVVVIVVIAVSA